MKWSSCCLCLWGLLGSGSLQAQTVIRLTEQPREAGSIAGPLLSFKNSRDSQWVQVNYHGDMGFVSGYDVALK